jgi:hypothetical protein
MLSDPFKIVLMSRKVGRASSNTQRERKKLRSIAEPSAGPSWMPTGRTAAMHLTWGCTGKSTRQ